MFQELSDLFSRTKRAEFLKQLDPTQLFLCLLIVAFHVLLLTTQRLERVENFFLDYFFRQRPPLKIHPQIQLIDVDEESLQAVGDWPWPWDYHAQMTDLLREWGAEAIVFDFILTESSVLDESGKLQEAFGKTKQIYLATMLSTKAEKKIWVHALPIVLETGGDKKVWIHSSSSLEKSAKGIGHINMQPDPDGVVRRVPLYLMEGSEGYPNLGLKVAWDFQGHKKETVPEPPPNPPGTVHSEMPALTSKLPTDYQGNLLINWAGASEEIFNHYSYADLIRSYQATQQGLRPVIDPSSLKEKICVIGLTASGLGDVRVTSLSSASPSSRILANVINNILTGQFVAPVSQMTNIIILVVIGLFASALFVIFRNVPSFIAALVFGAVWAGAAFVFLWIKGIWIFVFHPLLLILSLFIFSAIYSLIVTGKEKIRLFDLATRDGLTGLYVIRHFREILNHVVEEAQKTKEPVALILIDIDNFKPINDTYGHPAGDMVLKKTAQVIYACFRSKRPLHEADFVARYGGEEFIVLLRNSDIKNAAFKVGERIRKAVEKAVFKWENTNIPVTISLGVSSLHPGENVPDLMVQRADDALYRAKRAGKNQVSVEESRK